MFDEDEDEEIGLGEESGADGEEEENFSSYDVPHDYEIDDNDRKWHGWLPPAERGGEPIYIEGVLPNTVLTRRAMEAVPKKLRRDPLIGLKESQENLLRICIRKIGDAEVGFRTLQGMGLDKFFTPKQLHFVAEYFETLTTPDQVEVESFLATVRRGTKK